ncbi:hypothetical protein D9M71_577890 [compost metagenome]
MLIAYEAAGQGVGAGLVGSGVGFAHHPGTGGLPVILGRGAVQARAGDQAVAFGDIPGELAEGSVVVEVGVLGPGHVLVGVDAHAAAFAVLVGLGIDTTDQLHVGPMPSGLDPCA